MNGQMLTSVTQIAWWCGGMGPYFRSHLRAKAGLFPRSALAPLKRSHQQQWCGEKGLLRKAWRAKSQRLARESSSAPTLCLDAFTASPTTAVRTCLLVTGAKAVLLPRAFTAHTCLGVSGKAPAEQCLARESSSAPTL
eukprot:TRINITY_DN15257_c0_g1_i1.p1 TRINITY_DN15257_c0_g1~~TRINITY_DN15257_c0_g1_i1.p1  ORF type:complete len:138 (-),score=15.49 TRINITY_DN15257_c0_g1_i1:90-503(-)